MALSTSVISALQINNDNTKWMKHDRIKLIEILNKNNSTTYSTFIICQLSEETLKKPRNIKVYKFHF